MRIIAIHLLNDFSGSPKVLMQLLKGFTKNKLETFLFTSDAKEGFLSNIENVNYKFFTYYFSENKLLRLFFYLFSQWVLFIKLAFFLKKSDVVYINTVLPFGAALIAKIRGCKVIYHIHETSIKPKILKQFLFKIVEMTANEVIYVSNFLAKQEPIKVKKNILYNVLENSFLEKIPISVGSTKNDKIVLMICSLKKYKGVDEFVALASMNSEYVFKLVVNASQIEIDTYFKNIDLPKNLFVFPTQKNTHTFYKEASVLLNLSDVNLWVETFGLTVLEGMAYGLPAIVPPVGGVTELVEDKVNGFLTDSKNLTLLTSQLYQLFTDHEMYLKMSKNAREKSNLFTEKYFENSSFEIVSKI